MTPLECHLVDDVDALHPPDVLKHGVRQHLRRVLHDGPKHHVHPHVKGEGPGDTLHAVAEGPVDAEHGGGPGGENERTDEHHRGRAGPHPALAPGVKHGEVIRQRNLQVHQALNLAVRQLGQAHRRPAAVRVDRGQRVGQQDERGQQRRHADRRGHDVEDVEIPLLRQLRGVNVVVRDGDDGAVVEDGDDNEARDGDSEEGGPGGIPGGGLVVGGLERQARDEEEEEQTKKEALEIPKLKSEILAGLVDHLKGLKKEDLSKIYGSQVIGEEEGDDEDDEEEEDPEESKKVKESIDQKIEDLDVSQDVEALVQGEDELSEDFKTKAATIFETAIKSKVRSELEKIQEENDKQMKELAETSMTSMVEKVDDYLNYVVEQWMSENELAIERGLKGEIAEDFISGLKGLFEDHYIDVPDEKYDILEANLTKIEELEDKLNKQMEENVQLKKAKGELVKESMIADVANGMTDTETEKFQSLVEDVEFSDEESYTEKLQTIRESYFGSKEVLTEEGSEPTSTEPVEEVSKSMEKYLKAIGRDEARAQK